MVARPVATPGHDAELARLESVWTELPQKVKDRLLTIISMEENGMTQTQLSNALGRNYESKRIKQALDLLYSQVTVHGPLDSSFHTPGNLRHLVYGWDVRDSSGID